MDLWERLGDLIERYLGEVASLPVIPAMDPAAVREYLERFEIGIRHDPSDVLESVYEGMRQFQLHTPHPRYFGLFNPSPATMGIAADTLVALFNPQLAAWSHSPFAIETERLLVDSFGERFGFPEGSRDGTFAGGGAEANHTAILVSLARAFPSVLADGLPSLGARPVLYVSRESHHSLVKAAGLCGLGHAAVRSVETDRELRMHPDELVRHIDTDRRQGSFPFLIVGTAGTTGAGAVDPLPDLARIAGDQGVWFHVDAAWGGAAALDPRIRDVIDGIELADSITFDAHKWLSVPMGAAMFLTRHTQVLARTFATRAGYMPVEAEGLDVVDPFAHSMQWSRRFIGLKLFMTLAVAGWDGYSAAISKQTRLGEELRSLLAEEGWRIVNRTRLPVVCFRPEDPDAFDLARIVARVRDPGEAWISTVRLGPEQTPAIRACITNFETEITDLRHLVRRLGEARSLEANASGLRGS